MEKNESRKGIIYSATNKSNGKMYIGQTICGLEYRKNGHFYDIKRDDNDNNNNYFHNALKKYGEKSFCWEIVEDEIDILDLNNKEIYYIKKYGTFGDGYNSTSGGNHYQSSEETKKKLSIKGKERMNKNREKYGKGSSPETVKKMSISQREIRRNNREKYGKGCSPETSKKISLSQIGIKPTEEAKKKMSLAQSGDKHYFYGKHHTEESKKKSSLAQSGEKNHFYGKHHTEGNKKKIKMRILKTGMSPNNSSGFKGVSTSRGKKWKATITYEGKVFHLGSFDTKIEAAIVFDNKLIELYGEENVTTNKSLGLY